MPFPDPLITSSPDRLGGTPVFADTRVPVRILFEYLADGETLEEFLRQYPDVSREHAIAVLVDAANQIERAATNDRAA
ncbi:MAG: DUF433 domain-containing protein [Proteobacteria bacterium]|nr:DUF433 domain-containing protein [Pseudomonadota bacterium]